MRKIRIEMSQAAKKRLTLLLTPDELPLPLDPESIRPFALVTRGGVLALTFQGTPVAYVPDEMNADKKSFDLRVVAAPSDAVDAALRRTVVRITQHLNHVGRLLSAEARMRESAHNAEVRARLEARDAERRKGVGAVLEALAPFWTADSSRWVGPCDEDAIRNAYGANAKEDAVRIALPERKKIYLGHDSAQVSILLAAAEGTGVYRGTDVLEGYGHEDMRAEVRRWEADGRRIDMVRLAGEIERMAARAARVRDPQRIADTLRTLPQGDYNLPAFFFGPGRPKDLRLGRHEYAPDADTKVSVGPDYIVIEHEGVLARTLRISPLQRFDMPVMDVFREMEVLDLNLSDDDKINILSGVLTCLEMANPESDFTPFRAVDMDAMTAAVAAEDTGYDI